MLFEEFQDGRILAILNLYVATTPPTKFQLDSTYSSGGDVKNVKLTTDDRQWTTGNGIS